MILVLDTISRSFMSRLLPGSYGEAAVRTARDNPIIIFRAVSPSRAPIAIHGKIPKSHETTTTKTTPRQSWFILGGVLPGPGKTNHTTHELNVEKSSSNQLRHARTGHINKASALARYRTHGHRLLGLNDHAATASCARGERISAAVYAMRAMPAPTKGKYKPSWTTAYSTLKSRLYGFASSSSTKMTSFAKNEQQHRLIARSGSPTGQHTPAPPMAAMHRECSMQKASPSSVVAPVRGTRQLSLSFR
mmetsp:Transcript_37283/g.112731  ORF Transcript_37283/g.112731 Transcript_37283/m.112731 type:complete len:248 (+) Transcript_37283:749-1492(+)